MKVHIIARCNRLMYPGVEKKLSQLARALEKKHSEVSMHLVYSESLMRDVAKIWKCILGSNSEIIITRCQAYQILFLVPLLIYRLRGGKVVIEVPTPLWSGIHEVLLDRHYGIIKKVVTILQYYISFPASLWVAHKVIQYSQDSQYFSLGLMNRMAIMTNGIDVAKIKARTSIPELTDQRFVLLGVASVSFWHGFDRVIAGIAKYVNQRTPHRFYPVFRIVGYGSAFEDLRELTVRLGVEDHVTFHGRLDGAELDASFEGVHVCVSSLGCHRKFLMSHSSLKSREYTARGFPFMQAGKDLDFNPTPFFLLHEIEDDEPIDIKRVYGWYSNLGLTTKKSLAIRDYAFQYLDYKSRVDTILKV